MASDKHKVWVAFLLVTAFLVYSFFLYASLPVKGYSINGNAAKGKMVWQKYNCNACHQVFGLGGYLGPDLTNVYAFKGRQYIKTFVENGTSAMPNFHLSGAEITELIAYLESINASGSSDPRTFTIKPDGTIEQ